jgi:hypothetical protein
MREDFLKDYVTVNERVMAFYARYPEGSIQSFFVDDHCDDKHITIQARAYRHPGDDRPGTGLSTIEVPGKTPYTCGSEVENCETSAWGRALAALGFEVKRGIASADEIKNKADGEQRTAAQLATPEEKKAYGKKADGLGLTKDQKYAFVALVCQKPPDELTADDVKLLITKLDEPGLVDMIKDVEKVL